MAQVTEEQLEKAWDAAINASKGNWPEKGCIIAALESVADDLRREGMMEDAKYLEDCENRLWASGQAAPAAALSVARHNILARANQLSPAKQKETA